LAESGKRLAVGALLDVSDRKVLDLLTGANDLRHLAPGIYFIRTGVVEKIQKVVVLR